jgi:hypothetical protein
MYKIRFATSYRYNSYINPNTTLIEKVVEAFGDKSEILKRCNILVYFSWKNSLSSLNKVLGSSYIKEIPSHKDKISNIEGKTDEFDYFLELSTHIAINKNDIFKVFTIAHEFQHILQYILFKHFSLQCFVLFRYFYIKRNDDSNILFWKLPHEYDARRKAKMINYNLYSKEKVNDFIKERIAIPAEKDYWEFIEKIDASQEYNFKEETAKLWKKYTYDIDIEIQKIIKKKNKLDDQERDLLEAYEYLNNCN